MRETRGFWPGGLEVTMYEVSDRSEISERRLTCHRLASSPGAGSGSSARPSAPAGTWAPAQAVVRQLRKSSIEQAASTDLDEPDLATAELLRDGEVLLHLALVHRTSSSLKVQNELVSIIHVGHAGLSSVRAWVTVGVSLNSELATPADAQRRPRSAPLLSTLRFQGKKSTRSVASCGRLGVQALATSPSLSLSLSLATGLSPRDV